MFLRHHSDRAWTASEIAADLRATESAIELRLADLTARGFLIRASPSGFSYDTSGEYAAIVDELAEVYRTRRTTVIQAIFSGPSEAVRSFSDAFLLGPQDEEEEEDDG